MNHNATKSANASRLIWPAIARINVTLMALPTCCSRAFKGPFSLYASGNPWNRRRSRSENCRLSCGKHIRLRCSSQYNE